MRLAKNMYAEYATEAIQDYLFFCLSHKGDKNTKEMLCTLRGFVG
jgi:hypothetical protein